MKKLYLSVVIPSYDEMANLRKGVLDKIDHFLKKKSYTYEVVIVDDGSKDGSVEFVEKFAKDKLAVRLVRNRHLGKAGAVTTGVLSARGRYILFTDMDQATPIEEVDKLLPFFDKGYDIVIGSRSSKRQGAPWTRILMARGMITLRKLLIGISDISDTQCGFKMFRDDVAKKLFNAISNFHNGFSQISGSAVSAGFDVELLYLAQKMNFTIKEVPVSWLYVETRRVSPLKDSIDGIRELLRIKANDLMGKYKTI